MRVSRWRDVTLKLLNLIGEVDSLFALHHEKCASSQIDELRLAWTEFRDQIVQIDYNVTQGTNEEQRKLEEIRKFEETRKLEVHLAQLQTKQKQLSQPIVSLNEQEERLSGISELKAESEELKRRVELAELKSEAAEQNLVARCNEHCSSVSSMLAQISRAVEDQATFDRVLKVSENWVESRIQYIRDNTATGQQNPDGTDLSEVKERRKRLNEVIDGIQQYATGKIWIKAVYKQARSSNSDNAPLLREMSRRLRELDKSYANLQGYAELSGFWGRCSHGEFIDQCDTCCRLETETRKRRMFDCGHWELLEQADWDCRLNTDFCSRCWSLASQIHKEKLNRSPNERPTFKRTPLLEQNDDTAVEYFKVHDRVTRYVKPEHGIRVKIESIEKIENPELDKRLYDVYNQLHRKDCIPELLIHGTQGNIAETIIKEGFKVGTKGMYGAGIYFATDTSKSAQYCREAGVKSLLLCEVLLGKTMVVNSPKSDLTLQTVSAAGFDSVFAKRNTKSTGGVANDEYIVYRPEQATPRYLVKFT